MTTGTPVPRVLASAEEACLWLRSRVAATGSLRTDSRIVQAGDAFIAWPGWATDGRCFVPGALQAGAAACLVEADGADAFELADERVAMLRGLKAATGEIAHRWFGQPSRRLELVATTGTNGKTSTACWVAEALTSLGQRSGAIGTLGIGEPPGDMVATGLTTPDPVTLHAALDGFVQQGFKACALEASSIGLVEHRLDGAALRVACFTNFTRDHLDYHGSMDAYWAAKRSLFSWPGLRAAVINIDDQKGAELAAELQASALEVWTVSRRAPARLRAEALRYTPQGLAFDVAEGGERVALQSTLVGEFNASNLLVVLGALQALGHALPRAVAAVQTVSPVPGRLQRVPGRDVEVVVDYAHTPDALAQVLGALRPLAAARGGRLVCLFGCGGNRDATKRPLMGAIAANAADAVVLTSDNPRHEEPAAILAQVLAGIEERRHVRVIENRAEAIDHAVRNAAANDVVLLAGKGHEDYQEIAGVKRPFSDLDEARRALMRRDATEGAAA
jgi:MurE/MurF fusion protein